MHRPRHIRCLYLVPLLVVVALTAGACGGSEHEQMIRRFFQASAMGDNTTLANIANVVFSPDKDGRAQNVSVVGETPAEARDLKLKELAKTFKEAQATENDYSKRMKEYQDKNLEAINRVLKVEQAGGKAKLSKKDAEVQAAWRKWRDDDTVYNKKLAEARKDLSAARKVADMSAPDKDATTFDTTEYTKQVTVTANVRTPANQTVKKTLLLTLQRVVLKDASGKTFDGKWMITEIKEAPAGKA